jgi:uncharacterized repeat protein (TIGR01451 family)/LPXTG-motif cell wall-anchored protein
MRYRRPVRGLRHPSRPQPRRRALGGWSVGRAGAFALATMLLSSFVGVGLVTTPTSQALGNPPGTQAKLPSAAAAPEPLFQGCSSLVTFDSSNENWRAATTANGTTVVIPPQSVEWGANEGNPGGAVIEDDLDGNWTELWTPELAANGYSTDYSFALGGTLQFDYRNDTGIGVDVYMGVVGANGAFYWYVFRSQITDATQWNRIRVPLDASQWHTEFDDDTGPVGPAPTDAEFAAAFSDVDRFTFSIEGQTGLDRTAFDNFGSSCDDLGDAPDSYGTLLANGGPAHRAVGHTPGTSTAPLMIGSRLDIENDGVPGGSADGDDTSGFADENGVAAGVVRVAGQSTSVVVSATNNTGEDATLAGWIDSDGNGTFDPSELVTVTVPANTGTADYELTFGASDLAANTYARFRLFPVSTDPADILPTGAVEGGEVEDYLVRYRALEIDKSSNATAQTRVGDTVRYEITVRNTGTAPYTKADPASLKDDLTNVLDDGTYNDDASAPAGSVSYTRPRLSWSGPLAAGDSVTIKYSVTLNKSGDQNLDNAAYQTACDASDPKCDPPPPANCTDGTDPDTGLACDETVTPIPHLTIEKASPDLRTARPGDTIHYEITVTNDGAAAFTDNRPASFIDDMTAVLDDGTFNNDETASFGEVTFSDPRLEWTGALDVDQSATITYSVVYTGDGDNQIDNIVFEPRCDPRVTGCNPQPPPCDESGAGIDPSTGLAVDCLQWPKPNPTLEIDKTSPDLASAEVGDTVTYAVTMTNTGTGDFTDARPARMIDDLSGVLDDATYNRDATAGSGEVSYTRPRITWTGALAADESVTVEYSVTLTGDGDQLLHNVAFEPRCDPTERGCDPPTPKCADGIDPRTGLACDELTDEIGQEPPGEDLPDTGSQVSAWTLLGAVLLLGLGTGAVVLARRRHDI